MEYLSRSRLPVFTPRLDLTAEDLNAQAETLCAAINELAGRLYIIKDLVPESQRAQYAEETSYPILDEIASIWEDIQRAWETIAENKETCEEHYQDTLDRITELDERLNELLKTVRGEIMQYISEIDQAHTTEEQRIEEELGGDITDLERRFNALDDAAARKTELAELLNRVNYIQTHSIPRIGDDGYWYIGEIKTNTKAQGAEGFSPIVDITKSGKVTTIKITDSRGEHSSQVLDGEGDMLKSVYDTDNDGIVDNAEKVNNHTVESNVPANAVFTDTTYTAGTGISINENNVISNTQVSAVWGNIEGTLSNQTDLNNSLGNLQNQIDDINSIGRFLSIWNCTTGLPETSPETLPYTYHTGDYYIVGTVGSTNYKPTGSSYTGTASQTEEAGTVMADDIYYYDGTSWHLQIRSQRTTTFANIAGQPSDNTNLAIALNNKQDNLVASSNIQIAADGKTISATDTTYSNATTSAAGLMSASDKSKLDSLATVATSGSYSDLSNKPTIPDELSDLTDDSTHRLVTDTEKNTWNNKSDFSGSYADLTNKPTIPSKTSDLNNDSGFIDNTVNNLTNYTLSSSLATVATSGSYNDLSNKPTIPNLLTKMPFYNGYRGLNNSFKGEEIDLPINIGDIETVEGFYYDVSIQKVAINTFDVSIYNKDAFEYSGHIFDIMVAISDDTYANGHPIPYVTNHVFGTIYVEDLAANTSKTKRMTIDENDYQTVYILSWDNYILGVKDYIEDKINDSGLFVAQYGTTTYAQIQDAVAKNKIVYCYVNGRYAFLAYAGTTNYEFQYYRSNSSHSLSNFDSIFVYKIESNGTWTTTERQTELYPQAGTGIKLTSSQGNLNIKVKASETTTWGDLYENLLFIDPYYDDESYSVGDYVYYGTSSASSGPRLYRCNTAIPSGGESFNPSHWDGKSLTQYYQEVLIGTALGGSY